MGVIPIPPERKAACHRELLCNPRRIVGIGTFRLMKTRTIEEHVMHSEFVSVSKETAVRINQAKKEQADKNMPKDIFTIYWILRNEKVGEPEEIAQELNSVLEKYPHWKSSEEYERKFRQELYKIFTRYKINIKQAVPLAVKIIKILKGTEK